jgi:Flp pilus assembly protein TadG
MVNTHCCKRLTRGSVALLHLLRAFRTDQRGVSIIVVALTLPAFIGAIGLAAEISYWQLHHRAMQNAADAAAIAAATDNTTNFSAEGMAVAAQYGFHNGTGQIVVTLSNPSSAPGCTANCYVATISDDVPVFFSQIVGYQGNVTVGSQHETNIAASAVATITDAYGYCILALASSGQQGITSHGAPNTNLNGCNTMSNSSADCTGHNLNADVGDAASTNTGCGIQSHSHVAPQSDKFAQLATNIPPNNCSSYPQETLKTGPSSLPFSNQLSDLNPPGECPTFC